MFPNYSKPGKGVEKRDPNQSHIKTFFEILSHKITSLIKANILHLFAAIPFFIVTMIIVGVASSRIVDFIVLRKGVGTDNIYIIVLDLFLRWIFAMFFTIFFGQGPATAGITYIIRNYTREEPCWLFIDFWKKIKENFKQSIFLWIIDLVLFYLFSVAFVFYWESSSYLPLCVLLWATLSYTMMHIYIYQIMITFELPLKNILKNSLIFAYSNAPLNLLLLLIMVAINVVIPYTLLLIFKSYIVILVMALLYLIFLPALTSFITNYFIYPTLEKYINIANEKQEEETSI